MSNDPENNKVAFFGKSFSTVGDNKANLCLYTAGDVKIKTPTRFVTIFKNGKLNVDDSTEIFSVSTEDEMDKTGIYLVSDGDGNDEVYLYIDGQKILLAATSDGFISYTAVQTLTSEQFLQALNNIGVYFNTLEDAQASSLTNGLAYIISEQQLYKVVDGQWSLYIEPEEEEEEEKEPLTQLQIGGIFIDGENFLINSDTQLTIQVDGLDYVIFRNGTIYVQRDVVLNRGVTTNGAARGERGLLIYEQNGETYLETDYLIVHNGLDFDYSPSIYRAYLGTAVKNLVTSASWYNEPTQVGLTLKYYNEFTVGDHIMVQTVAGNRATAGVSSGYDDNDVRCYYIWVELDNVPTTITELLVTYYVEREDEDEDDVERTVTVTIDPDDYDPDDDPDETGNTYGETIVYLEDGDNLIDDVTAISVISGDTDIYFGDSITAQQRIPEPYYGTVAYVDYSDDDDNDYDLVITLNNTSNSILDDLKYSVIYRLNKMSETEHILFQSTNNLELQERADDENIVHSKIGDLSNIDSPDSTSPYYYGFHVEGYGMYADNLNGIFGSWPQYSTNLEMPDEYYDDEMYDKVVPDIKWVKALLGNAKTNPPVLDQSLIEFDLDGGSAVVNVTADDEWSAFISGGWLIDEIDGDRISISIDTNETTIERTGVLTVVMNGLVACCQLTQVEGEQGAIKIWAESTPGFSSYVNILANRSLKDDLTVCVEGTKAEDESHFGPLCIEFKTGESTTGIQTDFGVSAASVVSVNDQEDPPLVTENAEYTW